MAVGTDTIKTIGRLVFTLERDGETTTRNIEIPYAVTDQEAAQTAVNSVNSSFVQNPAGRFTVQPANWRDDNVAESKWTTTAIRYEIVTTATTPITPEEITP